MYVVHSQHKDKHYQADPVIVSPGTHRITEGRHLKLLCDMQQNGADQFRLAAY